MCGWCSHKIIKNAIYVSERETLLYTGIPIVILRFPVLRMKMFVLYILPFEQSRNISKIKMVLNHCLS